MDDIIAMICNICATEILNDPLINHRSMGNLRLACKTADRVSSLQFQTLIDRKDSAKHLIENLSNIRRSCMANYEFHRKYNMMISTTILVDVHAGEVNRFRKILEKGAPHGLSTKSGGRRKQRFPGLVSVQPGHLSFLIDTGYTTGQNSVFAGIVERPLKNEENKGNTLVVSFGPIWSRSSNNNYVAHKAAALFEFSLGKEDISILFPRMQDLERICSTTTCGIAHSVAKFALAGSHRICG